MLNKRMKPILFALSMLLPGAAFAATPFQSCPTQAFLVQDNNPRIYGVDLSTGFVELLSSDLGTAEKINGIGFNYSDSYLYAWSYEHRTVARIGSELKIEPLEMVQKLDDNYYIGDVSLDGSHYYIYKKGSGGSHGLWRIGLDPAQEGYLTPERIIDGQLLRLTIYDFAFHPDNGQLYSVTRGGSLVSISPEDGSSQVLADLGEPGVYGAVYFDVNGMLYMSRNTDGRVFQVDVAASEPAALLFAKGPKSGNNDGARCALAPVVAAEESTVDFGDAPESYGTTLADNGPRHNTVDSDTRLGAAVDADTGGIAYPSTDSGDDGIQFVTSFAAGESGIVSVVVGSRGYVSGWIDFDRDGTFDDNERIVAPRLLEAGQHLLPIDVPQSSADGETWARFRIASQPVTSPVGGVADGEVEDHSLRVFGRVVSSSYFPGPDSYLTLAYEDLWPVAGDYDMNDFIANYRTVVNTASMANRNEEPVVDSVSIEGQIVAIGAAMRSGFGVELTGIPRGAIDPERLTLEIGGQPVAGAFLEAGSDANHAVFIIYPDARNFVSVDGGCRFYRTENRCGGIGEGSRFVLNVSLRDDIPASAIDDQLFNPFIFRASSRGMEVHLKNREPTARAYMGAFGTGDDASQPSSGLTYQTATGLPWAIVIGEVWSHPEESHDLLQTYPQFESFVTSEGASSPDWYRDENAVNSKLYLEF